MSKLILWNLVTLDGFFDGPKAWDLDWHCAVWGEEVERFSVEQLRSAAGLIFGRVTYEGMAAYWGTAEAKAGPEGEVAGLMNGLPKYVATRTLATVDWANASLFPGDAATAVRDLKGRGEGDLFVFGSAELSATLMREGLFDEYRLLTVPVVLGEGRPLFARGAERRKLRLLESRPMGAGGVFARYAPA